MEESLAELLAIPFDVLLESFDYSSSHMDWDGAPVLLEDHSMVADLEVEATELVISSLMINLTR